MNAKEYNPKFGLVVAATLILVMQADLQATFEETKFLKKVIDKYDVVDSDLFRALNILASDHMDTLELIIQKYGKKLSKDEIKETIILGIKMAQSDGHFESREKSSLKKIAKFMDLGDFALEKLIAEYTKIA